MRRAVLVVAVLAAALAASAGGATGRVVVVSKPPFRPAMTAVTSAAGIRLHLVSTVRRDPSLFPDRASVITFPSGSPAILAGEERSSIVFAQPGTTLVLYGSSVLAGFGPRGEMKYAFDLSSFGFPPKSIAPRAHGPQEVVWARQVGRLLVVQTSHLGYASDSANRNGYLTGIDLDSGKVRWRSPSLVANAGNFLVVDGMIVSGYGFTAEKDWLYLLDPKTGCVRDRLALPSMAEQLTRRGDRIVVRCYDAKVVVRLA